MQPYVQQDIGSVCKADSTHISRKLRFQQDFPEVDDILVEVKEIDFGGTGFEQTTRYNMYDIPHMGGHIDCSNPVCYDGGIALGAMIRDMTYMRRKEFEKTLKCQGYVESSLGRRKYLDGDCLHLFKIKIKLTYKRV